MSAFLRDAGLLLVSIIFGLYILVVMLRFLMQTLRADFRNPLAQFIVKVTNPPLRPLRRIIPGLGGIDVAALILLLLLQMVELWLIGWLSIGAWLPIVAVLWQATIKLILLALYVFLVAIIVQAILSWVQPGGAAYNPLGNLLHTLTAPLLRPMRRLIGPIGGIDLSPLFVIILLLLLERAITHLLSPV